MKKLATIAVVLLMHFNARAQSIRRFPGDKVHYSIDVFGGPSLVTALLNPGTAGENPLNLESVAGVGFNKPLGNQLGRRFSHFEIMTRIAIAKKDYSIYTQIAQLASTSSKVSNTYVTLSILPAILFGEDQRLRIFGGGYFSSLRASRTEIEVTTTYAFFRKSGVFNSRSFLKNYDGGIALGAGYSFELGKKINLGAQVVYEYGLVNIFDPPGLTPGIKPGIVNNRSLSFLLILSKVR